MRREHTGVNKENNAYPEYNLLYQRRLRELTEVAYLVHGPIENLNFQASTKKSSLPAFELAKRSSAPYISNTNAPEQEYSSNITLR